MFSGAPGEILTPTGYTFCASLFWSKQVAFRWRVDREILEIRMTSCLGAILRPGHPSLCPLPFTLRLMTAGVILLATPGAARAFT